MRLTLILTLTMFLLVGCESQSETKPDTSAQPKASANRAARPVAERAEDVKPVNTGDRAPGGDLRTADGERVKLSAVYAKQPSMLIFYRGGW